MKQKLMINLMEHILMLEISRNITAAMQDLNMQMLVIINSYWFT